MARLRATAADARVPSALPLLYVSGLLPALAAIAAARAAAAAAAAAALLPPSAPEPAALSSPTPLAAPFAAP